jgi:hypothetical protein
MRKETSKIQITAKLLVAAAAIVHLIFTYVHTNALLLLEDQICGFIMFLFVLLGLVTLFEATQIQQYKQEHDEPANLILQKQQGIGVDIGENQMHNCRCSHQQFCGDLDLRGFFTHDFPPPLCTTDSWLSLHQRNVPCPWRD